MYPTSRFFPLSATFFTASQPTWKIVRSLPGIGIDRVVIQVTSSVASERASAGSVHSVAKKVRTISLFVISAALEAIPPHDLAHGLAIGGRELGSQRVRDRE